MLNIIRSLNYSARRDNVNWITLISMLGIPAFVAYISKMIDPNSMNKLTPSVYFASTTMATVFIFCCFGIMILASKLVASDAGDKTINYELMAGHSRNRIFAARMVSGFMWGAGLVFIIMMIPVGVLNLIYGWGPETDKTDVLIRCVLCIFPILRLCAYNMMLASVARSTGKGIALGYASFMAVVITGSVMEEVFGKVVIYPTGFTNASYLLTTENSKYEVINGKEILIYDTAITGEIIWKTIAVSIIFIAIYLMITYINFKKTDRD
ncbi:MAG: ABC transporter permease [Eubacterium sp.]|nr:ABC transporter permease [Eubacterium sp.]